MFRHACSEMSLMESTPEPPPGVADANRIRDGLLCVHRVFQATAPVPTNPGTGADADWLLRALWLLLLCERWQQTPSLLVSLQMLRSAVKSGAAAWGWGRGGEGRERLLTQQFRLS